MPYKNDLLNWNDLRLFLAIARGGSLAVAARSTGVSAPTLGRRMHSLEHALGVTLFRRHQEGYDLTAKGRNLLTRSEALEEKVSVIERWRDASHPTHVVRIAADGWNSIFLAGNSGEICRQLSPICIELQSATDPGGLIRREVHLGIHDRRSQDEHLVPRRLGRVEFAVYGAIDYVDRHPAALLDRRFVVCDWVLYKPGKLKTPSTLWLEKNLRTRVKFRADTAESVLAAAAGGIGLAVLPCFIGEFDERLLRVSEKLYELGQDQWLVTHVDDHHNQIVNQAANGIIKLVNERSRRV